MKKKLIYLSILVLTSALSYAQCTAEDLSPNSNFTTTDGGSPGCDVGSYKVEGSVSRTATCANFSGASCGMVWYGDSYSLSCDFCVTFTIRMNSADVSDGLAFTFTNFGGRAGFPCSTPIGCDEGGNIGYNRINSGNANIDGSLTIEFDLFDNSGDGDADLDGMGSFCPHVAVVANGNNNTREAFACVPGLGDNTNKSVSICWSASNNQLTVSIDGTNYITLNSNIRTAYNLGNNVHFAFTSGYNSSFTGVNSVCNWDVIPIPSLSISKELDLMVLQSREKAIVQWKGFVEEENAAYFIEKSNDGRFWETLAQVDILNGQYIDYNPLPNKSYYRMKEIDQYEKISYSKIQAFSFNDFSNRIFSVYSTQNSSVVLNNMKDECIEVSIFAIQGQQVKTVKMDNLSVENIRLQQGIYIFESTEIGTGNKTIEKVVVR